MTNIQTQTSLLVHVGLTLCHFTVKACGLVLHPLKCGCVFLGTLGAVALKKWSWMCTVYKFVQYLIANRRKKTFKDYI